MEPVARMSDARAEFPPAGSVTCDVNVSTLLSRVMSCFDFAGFSGDRGRPRVVTSDLEFPAVPHILRAFQRYGAVPVTVPSRDGVEVDVERLVGEIDERTRLVIVSHATFETEVELFMDELVRRVRRAA